MLKETEGKQVKGTFSIEEFVDSLETPRKILIMVQAGQATDATIEQLIPHLDKGDIIIDGGNAYFLIHSAAKNWLKKALTLSVLGFPAAKKAH